MKKKIKNHVNGISFSTAKIGLGMIWEIIS